jgi:hypothetical protein
MQCGVCATENPLGAVFCFKCGRGLVVNEVALAVAQGPATSMPGLAAFEVPTREMVKMEDKPAAEEEPSGRAAFRVRCLGCAARFNTNRVSLHHIKSCPVCQEMPFRYENLA